MRKILISIAVLSACFALQLLLNVDNLMYLFMLAFALIGVTREYGASVGLKAIGIGHNLSSYVFLVFMYVFLTYVVYNDFFFHALVAWSFGVFYLIGDQRYLKKVAFWVPISMLMSIFMLWLWSLQSSVLNTESLTFHLIIILFFVYLVVFEMVFGAPNLVDSTPERLV